jgi:hypothetical protein
MSEICSGILHQYFLQRLKLDAFQLRKKDVMNKISEGKEEIKYTGIILM